MLDRSYYEEENHANGESPSLLYTYIKYFLVAEYKQPNIFI